MNTYFAVSLDLYNKKEYIIYSIGGKETTRIRELGELLFDFSDQADKSDRYNAAAEYLTCFSEKKIAPLLTDDFFEAQIHLHLNGEHRYSSGDVINCCSDKLAAFYVDDKLYMATEDNFKLLLQYYLDVIYSIRLFPRKCMSCNSFFLSGKSTVMFFAQKNVVRKRSHKILWFIMGIYLKTKLCTIISTVNGNSE